MTLETEKEALVGDWLREILDMMTKRRKLFAPRDSFCVEWITLSVEEWIFKFTT